MTENMNVLNIPKPESLYPDDTMRSIEEMANRIVGKKKKVWPNTWASYMKNTVSYDIQLHEK